MFAVSRRAVCAVADVGGDVRIAIRNVLAAYCKMTHVGENQSRAAKQAIARTEFAEAVEDGRKDAKPRAEEWSRDSRPTSM